MIDIVTVYTDGSYLPKTKAGGWAASIDLRDKTVMLSGHEVGTTNNKMELTAVLEALKAIKIRSNITIYSDSQYVINALTKWLPKWKKNDWVSVGYRGKPSSKIKNRELFEAIEPYLKLHVVSFVKVKAHSTDIRNNEVDEEARDQARLI